MIQIGDYHVYSERIKDLSISKFEYETHVQL